MKTYQFHEMTITFLEGVEVYLDAGVVFAPLPRVVWQGRYPHDDQGRIVQVCDPILIQYRAKNYLIDAGIGTDKMSAADKERAGIIQDNQTLVSLARLGLTPADIDVVIMTHLHNDHAGGLTQLTGDQVVSTYPNATIYVTGSEWQAVQTPNRRTRATYLEDNWRPIASQVVTYHDRLEVAPGIRLIHTGGHSVGHAIVLLEQAGDHLIHLADLMMTSIQNRPAWISGYDDYPMDSVQAKESWLPLALVGRYGFLMYHDAYDCILWYSEDGRTIEEGVPRDRSLPADMRIHKG